ncbi:hypothetical protein EDB80DRAFT_514823, partial [Ilyonectria destructans]
MQYMSQAMGWADNVILAMGPLGIITAIVGAIRVGGPSWLKAIIGRAREPRAVPEAELMSSTSHEVCELWNGHEIVRVMGEGPMREFIILLPEGGEDREVNSSPQSQADSTRGSRSGEGTEAKSNPQSQADSTKGSTSDQEMVAMTLNHSDNKYLEKYGQSPHPPVSHASGPLVIIRNTDNPDTHTPNLTLNVHARFDRGELYIVAAIGTILQFGVLVYSGFATYHPGLMLLKDGNPVAEYAFACTAAGTLFLVAGMLICSHVVEGSTSETIYRPVPGRQARSFAVFPTAARDLLMTSQRAPKRSLKGRASQNGQAEGLGEVTAVAGTMVCLGGYIVQFIGLRGMHWSASVAQLGATGVMTILRAWVRRNLAQLPKSQPLMQGYELDWLAMTLGVDHRKAPWLDVSRVTEDRRSRPWAEDGAEKSSWDWKTSAVQDP